MEHVGYWFSATLSPLPFIPFSIFCLLPSLFISTQVCVCKDPLWKWLPQWLGMAHLPELAFFSPAGVCHSAQITWLHLPPGYPPGNVKPKTLVQGYMRWRRGTSDCWFSGWTTCVVGIIQSLENVGEHTPVIALDTHFTGALPSGPNLPTLWLESLTLQGAAA